MQKCLSGTVFSSQTSSSNGAVGKSSSSSLVVSWKESSMCYCTGEDLVLFHGVGCYICWRPFIIAKHQTVAYRAVPSVLLRWVCLMWIYCGKWCSRIERQVFTWYRHGVLCRGVGIFKLSLLFSYPLPPSLSSHSKASFNVVIKQLNNISSGWFHSCCAEWLQKKAV